MKDPESADGKKLVVCLDGTWVRADKGKYDSNVVHLYRPMPGEDKSPDQIGGPAEQPSTPTLKRYDSGVGTRRGHKILGGALGKGRSRNIREGCKFLIANYVAGDEVYLFGFSRGAYTARSLAGLIRKISILKKENEPEKDPDDNVRITDGYEVYRLRDASPDAPISKGFRETFSWPGIRIKFLGVWDTVGSLGIPLSFFRSQNDQRFEFHDTKLSRTIDNAYHAMAIDEHRVDYQATPWDPSGDHSQKMEQVWFVGAHSDVGGGSGMTSLSQKTLGWMRDKAMLDGHGLQFTQSGDSGDSAQDYPAAAPSDPWDELKLRLLRLLRLKKDERKFRPVGATLFRNETVHQTAQLKIKRDAGYRTGNLGLWDSRFRN